MDSEADARATAAKVDLETTCLFFISFFLALGHYFNNIYISPPRMGPWVCLEWVVGAGG